MTGYRKAFAIISGIALTVAVIFGYMSYETPEEADASVADVVEIIRPNGNGTIQSDQTSCGAGGAYDCLNDGSIDPAAPTSPDDNTLYDNGEIDFILVESPSETVDVLTNVDVHINHMEGTNKMATYVSLWDATESTEYTTQVQTTYRSSATWDTVTFSGLSLTSAQTSGLRLEIDCHKPAGGGPNDCFVYEAYLEVTYTPAIDVTVGTTTATQLDLDIDTTNNYVGGAFTIEEETSSRNITSISINEAGTVDAQNDLDNIKIYYDKDTSNPYDCESESYGGGELQYGSTDTDGFDGANGTSTFTQTLSITTASTFCGYVVLDVLATATDGETIEIQMNSGSQSVSVTGGGVVDPIEVVELDGTTTLTDTGGGGARQRAVIISKI